MTKDLHPLLREMVSRLEAAASHVVRSVILYGPAAHGDYAKDTRHFYLLIVLRELDLDCIGAVGDPIRWWLKKGEPMPRLMSPGMLREAADVFPIELSDIRDHHVVLFGADAMDKLEVEHDHLRLQCERELREKLMRVQEAFIEADGRDRALTRLLTESYLSFAPVFRGCLRLATRNVPAHDIDVVRAFCKIAGLDAAPFEDIAAMVGDGATRTEAAALFDSYYAQLSKVVGAVDRFQIQDGGKNR
jgi:hypothetical protein